MSPVLNHQSSHGRRVEADQDRTASVTQNQLLGLLPPNELSALTAQGKTVELRKNQLLTRRREAVDHVYFPHAGLISLTATLPDGKAVEIGSIGMQGALGVSVAFGFRMAVSQAVVLVPCLALRVPAQKFAMMAEEFEFLRTLVSMYKNTRAAQTAELVACTAFHDAQARFSRYLLHARDCIGSPTLPLTQEMISEALGVRRTTITFIAGALQAKGLISCQRGAIEISNENALENLACPCYRSMRSMNKKLFSVLRPGPLRLV